MYYFITYRILKSFLEDKENNPPILGKTKNSKVEKALFPSLNTKSNPLGGIMQHTDNYGPIPCEVLGNPGDETLPPPAQRREDWGWTPGDGRVLTGDGIRGVCSKRGKAAPPLGRTINLIH